MEWWEKHFNPENTNKFQVSDESQKVPVSKTSTKSRFLVKNKERNLVSQCIDYQEYLGKIPLQWRNITYWATPALPSELETFRITDDASAHFCLFEIMPISGIVYRLVRNTESSTDDFDTKTNNVWNLQIISSNGDVVDTVLGNELTLPDLIAFAGVLSKEDIEHFSALSDTRKNTLKQKYKKWLVTLPSWLSFYK